VSVDHFMPRLQEAERMVNQDKGVEAEAACRAVLHEAPGLPEATALLGFIVARLRRLPEAEALLREAIARRPDVPHWHFELRNVLRRGFRLDESLAEAREAVRLDPNSAQFHNGLSQVHFDRGEYDQGYDAILTALACDPEHPESHLSLAHALLAWATFGPAGRSTNGGSSRRSLPVRCRSRCDRTGTACRCRGGGWSFPPTRDLAIRSSSPVTSQWLRRAAARSQ
jgi:tetratricopeptide (TPR) repeat protein